MQFGWAAFDEIIHVSDQPVEPSLGKMAFTGTLAASRTPAWYCQVVPTTMSPLVNESICCWAVPQYVVMFWRCALSRSTAALNCVSSRAYGFLIASSGFVAMRYTAASAM